MNETNPPPQDTPPPTPLNRADKRVSTLVGDRLCIKCHYNLCGQPIVREAHYGMLIVRCPECATVASLQEHPLLGRWAGRWAVVLVGLWLALLLGFWFATSSVIYFSTQEAAMDASEPYVLFLAEKQSEWLRASGTEEHQQARWPGPLVFHTGMNNDWWRMQNPAALLAEAGGWMRIADWRALWSLVRWGPLFIMFGCLWALLLPHVRRRWLPVWTVAIIALALVFLLMSDYGPMATPQGWPIRYTVFPQVGMKVHIVAMMAAAAPFSIGLLIGRSIARGVVRAILPPRLRGSLAGLWRIDNLPPPPGVTARRW